MVSGASKTSTVAGIPLKILFTYGYERVSSTVQAINLWIWMFASNELYGGIDGRLKGYIACKPVRPNLKKENAWNSLNMQWKATNVRRREVVVLRKCTVVGMYVRVNSRS